MPQELINFQNMSLQQLVILEEVELLSVEQFHVLPLLHDFVDKLKSYNRIQNNLQVSKSLKINK